MTIFEYLRDLRKTVSAHFKGLKEGSLLNKPKGIDIMKVHETVHEEFAPVFVLSTGRCGTMLLAHVLEMHPEARVFHDPYPELARVALHNYYHREALEYCKGIVEGARYEMIRDAFLLGKIYIEPNNKITFLAPAIRALYPRAKFIHMIRKKEGFVRSGLQRQWYAYEKLADEGRIAQPEPGWSRRSREEKVAWLWDETNQWIEVFLDGVDPSQKMTVRSEEFFKQPEVSAAIFRFVGLEAPSLTQIKRKISKKVNESK